MLTPLEIHNKEFKRSFRGYDEEEVDEFLDQVIADYEQLYKENMDLRDMVSRSEGNIGQYKDLEDTLKNALIVAQQTSDKMKSNAEKEGQIIVLEATSKAERIMAGAQTKFERIMHDYERMKNQVILFRVKLKSFLELQLAMVEEYEDVLLNEESKKTALPKEANKQKLISEVNQEVSQLDKISNNINKIVDKQDFISPTTDLDFKRSLDEVAGGKTSDNINTYDLNRKENESSKQNTVIFSKEEVAAAIDNNNDKTIF